MAISGDTVAPLLLECTQTQELQQLVCANSARHRQTSNIACVNSGTDHAEGIWNERIAPNHSS